jgi:hypothetical protein
MKPFVLASFFLGFFLVNTLTFSNELPPVRRFIPVFDGTLYINKPDLSEIGFDRILILYESRFFEKSSSKQHLPEENIVRKLAREAKKKGKLVVIDIECWPIQGVDADVIKENVKKYVTVLRWVKDEEPDLKVGYFGRVPVANFDKSSSESYSLRYLKWKFNNDLLKPIADDCDILFPEGYTYSDDIDKWFASVTNSIKEARRISDKPIYIFLFPQYVSSVLTPKELRKKYIPPDFWKFQLETAKKYADGIVIWGGWDSAINGPAQWDDKADWWLELKKTKNN